MVDDDTRNETSVAERVLVAVSRYNEGVTRNCSMERAQSSEKRA